MEILAQVPNLGAIHAPLFLSSIMSNPLAHLVDSISKFILNPTSSLLRYHHVCLSIFPGLDNWSNLLAGLSASPLVPRPSHNIVARVVLLKHRSALTQRCI